MRKDLHNNIKVEVGLDFAAIGSDGDNDGNIIDTQGFGAIEWAILSGAITDGTYTPRIEEGDDPALSDAAPIASDAYLGAIADATFAASDDDAVKKIGAKVGTKRYMRLTLVSAGTTTGGSLGSVAIFGNPDLAPVS